MTADEFAAAIEETTDARELFDLGLQVADKPSDDTYADRALAALGRILRGAA